MSNYSEYIKKAKKDDRSRFFGEVKEKSNKYFTFRRVIDEDNIIILTNNVRMIRDSFVLIVGNNEAIYLKDWQVREVHNYDEGINTYAVKLNRNFMKAYTFQSDFEVGIEGVETFDDLMEVARMQDEVNMAVASGWMGE